MPQILQLQDLGLLLTSPFYSNHETHEMTRNKIDEYFRVFRVFRGYKHFV
jgi:hypothetical protein